MKFSTFTYKEECIQSFLRHQIEWFDVNDKALYSKFTLKLGIFDANGKINYLKTLLKFLKLEEGNREAHKRLKPLFEIFDIS